jgi:transposase
MVSGYSRWLMAQMLPSRAAGDLFAGMWSLLAVLGAVPKTLVWDNEGAIGAWKRGRPQLTQDASAFRGTLGVKILQCRPADPEAKGRHSTGVFALADQQRDFALHQIQQFIDIGLVITGPEPGRRELFRTDPLRASACSRS